MTARDFDPDMHIFLQMHDGREVRMDRNNSALFTFLGKTAMGEDMSLRDHVFVRYGDEEEPHYSYIFRRSPVFEDLEAFIIEYDFPQHLNMVEIGDMDEQAYNIMIDKEVQNSETDLGDFLPDTW